jgi:hypothetical protein
MPTADPKTEEERKRAYDKIIADAHQAQVGQFTQLVLAVSGGSIGLSVTFMEKIAGEHPTYLSILYVSWLLFCLSLLVCYFQSLQVSTFWPPFKSCNRRRTKASRRPHGPQKQTALMDCDPSSNH